MKTKKDLEKIRDSKIVELKKYLNLSFKKIPIQEDRKLTIEQALLGLLYRRSEKKIIFNPETLNEEKVEEEGVPHELIHSGLDSLLEEVVKILEKHKKRYTQKFEEDLVEYLLWRIKGKYLAPEDVEIIEEIVGKFKILKREIINMTLNNGDSQKVILMSGKGWAISKIKKNEIWIYKDDFLKELDEYEQKAAIYHERGHLKSINKTLFNISESIKFLFIIFLGFLPFLILSIFVIPKYKILIIIGLLITPIYLSLFTLFNWLVETICDANAIKNGGKDIYKSALSKIYDKTRDNFLKRLWNENITHVPKKWRFKIIDSFDGK